MPVAAADALDLPLHLAALAAPIASHELVETFGGQPGALGERVEALRQRLGSLDAGMRAHLDAVDAALGRAGIPGVSPRPTTFSSFESYLRAVLPAAEAALDPAARGAWVLGRAVAGVLQSLELHALVAELLDASPGEPELTRREAQVDEDRPPLVARLRGLGEGDALPEPLRAPAQRLAQVAAASTRQLASLRATIAQLRGELAQLHAALGGARISATDAFLATLHATQIGIPMSGMQLMNALAPGEGALAPRIASQQRGYQALGGDVGALIVDVEGRLQRSQLAVPARPNTYAQYVAWNDAVAQTVAAATGPARPEGALAALGRAVGETIQAVGTLAVILALREVAPDEPRLRQLDTELAQQLPGTVERLVGMAQFSTLPASVRAEAEAIATTARLAVGILDANVETRRAGLEMVSQKLWERTAQLRAALERAN